MPLLTKSKRTEPATSACDEVKRLHARERELVAESQAKHARIAELEASAGDAILAGGSVATAVQEIAQLRAEIVAAGQAVEILRKQRRELIPQAWAEEAAELRARIPELQAEAAQREQKTLRLLAELEAHDGVPYRPVTSGEPKRERLMVPEHILRSTGARFPKSQWLRDEAERLQITAEEIARRRFENQNAVATDLEELIIEANKDPFEFAPSEAAIRAWAAEQETARRAAQLKLDHERRSARDRGHERIQVRYRLVWRDGQIITSLSNATQA